jgi:prolyl oligopeptidase
MRPLSLGFERRLALMLALAASASHLAAAQAVKSPPHTRTVEVVETIHGVTIADPYRWLEDQNSPETRAWIEEQNRYTESLLNQLPWREQIRKRLEQLLRIDTIGIPIARGGRYFFMKRRADQNQAAIYMREGPTGKDQLLVDPNAMSPDQTVSVNIVAISDDGKLLAYGTRQGGEDEITITFMDVDSRKPLQDRMPRGRYFGIAIKPDKSGFYYSRFGPQGSRVYYHAMGSDPAKDQEIFGGGYGPGQIISASLSEDGRYLVISVSHGASGDRVEIYVQDLSAKGPITPITGDLKAGFSGGIVGNILYLRTNWQAPNWRIVAVKLDDPAPERWRTLVPESSSVISGFSLAGGKIFVNYVENVSSRIKVFDPSGKYIRDIALPQLGSASGIIGRWKEDEAFYSFNSFAQPPTIYRYQISNNKQEVWARINIPIEPDEIQVKQIWYESKDGTRVPMFIVHRKGLKLDGQRPTLLTGYGGFNISLLPTFSARAALWVESGGVFAQPNLRGGGEFGEKWHRDGMLDKKQNVFDDFIAAAQWLIKNGYTNPSKLAISGGSNGGLLVGAAMTQRPELFQAVVCSYPLLDMVRYHKFLVARFWVPEYGSSEDPKQFQYIYRYSPYHNVKKGVKYPAVLFITGDADTRVDPLHARKMTALMQAWTGSDRPILLHYDTKAGHSGGLPVSKQIEDLTDELSFLFWQLGFTT